MAVVWCVHTNILLQKFVAVVKIIKYTAAECALHSKFNSAIGFVLLYRLKIKF